MPCSIEYVSWDYCGVYTHVGDHMGCADGASVHGPSGTHPCRYCLVYKSDLAECNFSKIQEVPHLRDPHTYESTICTARDLMIRNEASAATLLQENGYREAVVSF